MTRDPLGTWYAGRFEDVDFSLKDRRFGKQPPSGAEGNQPAARLPQQRDRRTILNVDPADHIRLRGLVAKSFSARRIEEMRPSTQPLVDGVIDRVESRGSMGLVSEYAFPIPATIISDMLGIPDADRPRFAGLSNGIIAFGSGVRPDMDPEVRQQKAQAASEEFDRFLMHLFELKRRSPADDLTTALIRAEDEECKLTEEELTQNVRLLFMAGHETTVNLMSNAMVVVFCVLGSANRDPEVYPEPDVLDIERLFVRAKSFGGGVHFCLGAQLARIETEVALNTLFARLPSLRVRDLNGLRYPLNPIFRGPEQLVVEWDV